jgi:hypothetical protein
MSHSRSPRKKKAKRRAEDPAPTGKGKKARASAEISTSALVPRSDADEVPPRRSTRPGAGTGGRNTRLEILGAVLEAPTRMSQPKGSTTLAPNIPVNPLAPIPPHKGRGKRKQVMQSHPSLNPVTNCH